MTIAGTSAPAQFLNNPADAVTDYLIGLAAAHPELLHFDRANRIVVRADGPVPGKVAVISGGGSGCEPLHTGLVGPGLLDAACPGEIFSSPVPDQILAATQWADVGSGVLHIIKNFTGEVMNFEMAAELAEDDHPTEIESVIVNDDVAVLDLPGTAGRRGLGATVLVEKIAAAAAERGDSLASVAEVARRVVQRTRTFGIGLSSCTRPGASGPIFDLPDGAMELGIGISGEPGRRREAIRPARELAAMLVWEVLADLQPRGTRILVMVNGMGGTPIRELYLLYGEVDRLLREVGLEPVRRLVGNFITSLDQSGAALSVLELDDELTSLWDAPVHSAALRWGR
jgi:dihydroxyacetone kinase-like protein